jgi:hypothetical protein
MAKGALNYPRYNPNRLRPKGAGAFFDFAAGVETRDVRKLKSCSLLRRWGKGAVVVHVEAAEQDAVPLSYQAVQKEG